MNENKCNEKYEGHFANEIASAVLSQKINQILMRIIYYLVFVAFYSPKYNFMHFAFSVLSHRLRKNNS